MTYEELLLEAEHNNLITKEKDLRSSKGRIKGNKIAIRKGMSDVEKACVMAEELGHHYTTVGDILDQSTVENRKQELKARAIAYNKMIGTSGILESYKAGCRNKFEIADYLNVTENFLEDAISYYKLKYGICVTIDKYLIYFEPLGVLKLYNSKERGNEL